MSMKTEWKFLALCSMLFCVILFSSEAESAFTDRGGVRPMGMGGAFVALADDTSAIMFNPAGLGQIQKAQVAAAYDKLYAGLDDGNLGRGFVSYVQPSQYYGAFALNLALLHAPLYKETTVTFGYGKSFGRAKAFAVGLNTKGLFASFEENDYTKIDPLFSNGMSTNGVALDLGMLYKLTDSASFGLAVLNVNQPNMAIGEDADGEVPFMLQTGIALRLGRTVPTIDVTYRNKKLRGKQDINLHLGVESWSASKNIALRAGVNFYDMALGASYVFGLMNMDAQLDYAFRYPLIFKEDAISSMYGSHQFSLNVRFGGFAAVYPEGAVVGAAHASVTPVWKDAQSEARALINKVIDCRNESKYEEGINLCNEILKMEFDGVLEYHVEAHMQMGGMLTRLGRYDEALNSFQAAVKLSPQDPRTHYELGVLYKQYGDRTGKKNWYNKAIIELERTRIIDPMFEDVSSELATLKKTME
jgi:tetratricopeptide (TPR) repeat protein